MMDFSPEDLKEEQLQKIQQRDTLLRQIQGKNNISAQRFSQAASEAIQDDINRQLINYYLLQFFGRDQQKVDVQYRLINKDDMKQWAQQAKLTQNGYKLNHFNDYASVNVQQFLTNINWNHLEVLDLSYCSIDNDGWKMLVDNAHLFLNLKVLVIYQNKIRQIRERDLQKFRSLQSIQLQFNPLSYTSKDVLTRFVKFNPKVTVNY